MKRKAFLATTILVMSLGCSVTAYAQPKAMPDGNVFDAEFYAATYPDVVAVFGTDENMLYQHYVQYGISEGRMAVSAVVPENTVVAQTPSIPGKDTYDKYKPVMDAYILDAEGRFIELPIENDYDAALQMYIDGLLTEKEADEIKGYLDAIHPENNVVINKNVVSPAGAGFTNMN